MLRWILLGCIVVFSVLTVLLGMSLAVLGKRADEVMARIIAERLAQPPGPVYTVRWIRHGAVECAYRGTITELEDDHIVIEGDDGPVVVDRANITEAF